ncbi:alpha/beta hydrolase-fold protein [Motilimonas sp. 1_MG-2023]|uniref:alpha/beta hydrolase n=1 Tax=Motilimonas sp. 1_MG-2023 TaxID=3062672 RepID=UPI0026E42DF6|nr:alpha/beta hydrolase-fold protein [Motilimonas sp. 1_MG-2023]MDO6524692.1 alpha/beta hydrolase-fold protein [Motilimonas sp. 1_MG-2023]
MNKLFFSILLSAILFGCGGGGGGANVNEGDNVLNQKKPQPYKLDSTEIASSITNITYKLDIYVPVEYQAGGAPLPVIYASDGQWRSNSYKGILESSGVSAVLVAIHEGPKSRRNIDYLTPGVYDYYEFLTQELIPFVESEYSVLPTNRTLVGHSYGGAMSFYSMLIADPNRSYFDNFVSADPSVADTETLLKLEEERFHLSKKMNSRMILTGAMKGGNGPDVEMAYAYMQNRKYEGLNITLIKQDVTHDHSADQTFKDALPLLFP